MVDNKYIKLNVVYAGICGSDINKVRAGKVDLNDMTLLGHEIVAVDSSNNYFIVNPFICEEICSACPYDSVMFCKKTKRLGAGVDLSGYSGKITVPYRNLYKIPGNVEPSVGVFSDGIAVVLHALNFVDMINKKNILIIGGGTIGVLTALVIARSYKNVNIVVATSNESKKEYLSKHYSCFFNVSNETSLKSKNMRYDLVIEAIGGNQTTSLSFAIDLVKNSGKIIVIGAFDNACKELSNLRNLFYKEITLKGVNSYSVVDNDFSTAVSWTINNSQLLYPLITDWYSLKRNSFSLSELYDDIIKKKTIKGCIRYE